MNPKILITGPPRCGKSTLIYKLINELQVDFKIHGFLSPEKRKGGKRIGFDLKDINTGLIVPLAKIGDFNTGFKLGRYNIFIDEFNTFLNETLLSDFNNVNTKDNLNTIFFIDEIGKMELYSLIFQDIIKKIYKSRFSVIATIGERLNHPVKNNILKIPSIKLLNLTFGNQQVIIKKIMKELRFNL